MQRLFTSFPDGWPGIGLLVLRCVLGAEFAGQILQRLFVSGPEQVTIHLADVLAILVAVSLSLGVFTPLAAIAGGVLSLFAVTLPGSTSHLFRDWEMFRIMAFASSIALIGPGAYSIDGRLFGRREIIVPRLPPSEI